MTGLERSCDPHTADWVRTATSRPGFERVEASFATLRFAPHRHDTYAIGITLRGVQSFGYRGTTQHSVAGGAFVIHPDERHDGRAGTAEGLHYRIVYLDPRIVLDTLPARALPFVRDAVIAGGPLHEAIVTALDDDDVPIEDVQYDAMLLDLVDALSLSDPSSRRSSASPACERAVGIAREFLDENIMGTVPSEALERLTGLSRFALCRHFRQRLGTSPHRYVVMRRLERAKHLMHGGSTLAQAASASGFADQSHMTRHFKRTYGVSPGRWQALMR